MTNKKEQENTNGSDENEIEEQDFVLEDDEETVESSGISGKLKDMREKLKTCEAEKREYLEGWQRARAEITNIKKEHERSREEFLKYAKKGLLVDMLAVLDSFDMAFSNKDAWEKIDKGWRMGVEHIHAQFLRVLEENGMTPFDPKGEVFDPNRHESVDVVETDDESKDHVVLDVIQTGYSMHGRIVRPAKVRVGKYVGKA